MSGLPKRFPRTALIERAGLLELAITKAQDETFASQQAVNQYGDSTRYQKYQARLDILEQSRKLINAARLTLWDLQ